MAIKYVTNPTPWDGTADDDIVIGTVATGGDPDTIINGGDGDDLVLADMPFTANLLPSLSNGGIVSAYALHPTAWSLAENPLIADALATPHASLIVTSSVGEAEYLKFDAAAGAAITIDIDFGHNSPIGVGAPDLIVELRDATGALIATADNSQVTDGGLGSFAATPGSTLSLDPYLQHVATTAGTYYVKIRPAVGATFDSEWTFLVNLSVSSQAVTAPPPPAGDDSVNGGNGADHLFGMAGADMIDGGAGNDVIDGGSGADIILGGDGNDILDGGAPGAEEDVRGGEGNDRIISTGTGAYRGEAGDDFVIAGNRAGSELLDGGEGVDTLDLRGVSGNLMIDLATGATGRAGKSFTGFERLYSGDGADQVTGTVDANVIRTGAGNDTIDGGGGNDVLDGGAGDDVMRGGTGFDTVTYVDATGAVSVNLRPEAQDTGGAGVDILLGVENLIGSAFDDSLTGNGGANRLVGGRGDDRLSGSSGDDRLEGDSGDDILAGGLGDDIIDGGSGFDIADYSDANVGVIVYLDFYRTVETNVGVDTLIDIEGVYGSDFGDVLSGGADSDWLYGGDGVDFLEGVNLLDLNNGSAGGNNTLNGGAGNDFMKGGLARDIFIGGDGVDEVSYSNLAFSTSRVGVTVNLSLSGAQDTGGGGIDTMNGIENLMGTGFGDVLIGSNVDNRLDGGTGNDRLVGGQGRDRLLGGSDNDVLLGGADADRLDGSAGDDVLHGGLGIDTLNGGGGKDSFVFDTRLDPLNVDRIEDFKVPDDTIVLDHSIFALSFGELRASAFRIGTAALDRDDRIIFNSANGSLYYDADGSGAGEMVRFAVVESSFPTTTLALTNADFVVI
jgi:Ca2+-binding RTX toxin-like protein